MKKILFVCSSSPFKIVDGVNLITYNLIKEFSKDYLVDVAIPEDSFVDKSLIVDRILFYKKSKKSLKMIRDFFKLNPLYFHMYYDDKLKRLLKKNIKIMK